LCEFTVCGLIAAGERDKFDLQFDVSHPSPPTLKFVPHTTLRDADVNDAFSIQRLLDELGDRWQFSWIKQRLQMMWPEINVAARHVTNASCSSPSARPRLRVSDNFYQF